VNRLTYFELKLIQFRKLLSEYSFVCNIFFSWGKTHYPIAIWLVFENVLCYFYTNPKKRKNKGG